MRERKDAQLENFNPHSRKGSDSLMDEQLAAYAEISIHTPARGVTGIGLT